MQHFCLNPMYDDVFITETHILAREVLVSFNDGV